MLREQGQPEPTQKVMRYCEAGEMKIRDWSEFADHLRSFTLTLYRNRHCPLPKSLGGTWELLFEVELRFRNRFCISRTTEGYANVFRTLAGCIWRSAHRLRGAPTVPDNTPRLH